MAQGTKLARKSRSEGSYEKDVGLVGRWRSKAERQASRTRGPRCHRAACSRKDVRALDFSLG